MKRGRPADPNRALSVKQERFIAGLVAGKTQRAAAIDAGFQVGSVDTLMANPRVQQALAAARATVREHASNDARVAFDDLSEMITDARAAKQFTAVAKLQETRMKLLGLLIERVATATIDLRANERQVELIAEAESRLRDASREYLTIAADASSEPPDIFSG